MASVTRLAAYLFICGTLLATGCSKPAPAPVEPGPAPGESLQFRHEELAETPPAVQEWVGKLRNVPIGASLNHGDRTYLLVAAPNVCPEGASLFFSSVQWAPADKVIQATAAFNCTQKQNSQPLALASIPATEKPVDFDLKYSLLPHLNNPLNLPLPALPAEGSGVIVEPAPGAAVGARIRCAGFAAGLFEGTLNVRLVDPTGKVMAETHGNGAGGMGPDWGSFFVELDASKAPPGRYWLELGDHSMKDGTWQLKQRIEVSKQ